MSVHSSHYQHGDSVVQFPQPALSSAGIPLCYQAAVYVWLNFVRVLCDAACNVAGGACVTLAELIRLVEEATGVQADVEVKEQRQADVSGTYADISAAADELGWHPEVRGVRHCIGPGLFMFSST